MTGTEETDVYMPTAVDVKRWFENCLGRDEPKPTNEKYFLIAENLRQLIGGWYADLDKPLVEISGASLDQIISNRFTKVIDKSNELLAALESLEEVLGGGLWNREHDGFPFQELKEFLEDMGISGHVRTAKPASRGQPRADWHRWAISFCRRVQDALKDVGYKGNLKETDANSGVAFIGAWMIKDVLKQAGEPNADTFAAAMRGGRKSRKKSPKPNPILDPLSRIRVLD